MKKILNIIGGGPAGLMAADFLSREASDDIVIHVYEKGKTVGRKFLVAGKGGFNLSNKDIGEDLIQKYLPASFLAESITAFDSEALREWLKDLGIPTFVGTSGRVFPIRGIKPIEVLQRWRDRLVKRGIHFHLQEEFIGFKEMGKPLLRNAENTKTLEANYTIFALGGASWSVTGSAGDWLGYFDNLGIATIPFRASNCGVHISWPAGIKDSHAGKPLKNMALSAEGKNQKGEAVITDYGLEGNALYPLLPSIRKQLDQKGNATLFLDLKPNNSSAQILSKIEGKASKNYAKALNLSAAELALLKAFTDKATYTDPQELAKVIKQLPLPVEGLRPIEEAISTVGGISREEVATDFSLKKYPSIFVIGEMLDWDAPTGGYLLQACFSMGVAAGRSILYLCQREKKDSQ